MDTTKFETAADAMPREQFVSTSAGTSIEPWLEEQSIGTLHGLFEKQARRTPNAMAVACGDRQLSYRELDLRAQALARRLKRSGVERGALVGLCVERSLDLAVGLLGILKAGAAYVPLDPVYPAERLAFMLADTEIRVLVAQHGLRSICQSLRSKSFTSTKSSHTKPRMATIQRAWRSKAATWPM